MRMWFICSASTGPGTSVRKHRGATWSARPPRAAGIACVQPSQPATLAAATPERPRHPVDLHGKDGCRRAVRSVRISRSHRRCRKPGHPPARRRTGPYWNSMGSNRIVTRNSQELIYGVGMAARGAAAEPLVHMKDFRMDFGGTKVIRDLSFDVRAGETFGSLGAETIRQVVRHVKFRRSIGNDYQQLRINKHVLDDHLG
jgi:hypothetical protein